MEENTVQRGVRWAYEYGGDAYGALTEAFWTATGLYERPEELDAALIVTAEYD